MTTIEIDSAVVNEGRIVSPDRLELVLGVDGRPTTLALEPQVAEDLRAALEDGLQRYDAVSPPAEKRIGVEYYTQDKVVLREDEYMLSGRYGQGQSVVLESVSYEVVGSVQRLGTYFVELKECKICPECAGIQGKNIEQDKHGCMRTRACVKAEEEGKTWA